MDFCPLAYNKWYCSHEAMSRLFRIVREDVILE